MIAQKGEKVKIWREKKQLAALRALDPELALYALRARLDGKGAHGSKARADGQIVTKTVGGMRAVQAVDVVVKGILAGAAASS